jgi:hypothetical protein
MRTGREFEMPAQFTKILIGPSSFSTSAMAAFTALLSVPSTCHPLAGAPAFSFLTSSIVSAVSRKSKAATVAPVFAKARQIPCPIPLAEPTIRTVQGLFGVTDDEDDIAFVGEVGRINGWIDFLVENWRSDHVEWKSRGGGEVNGASNPVNSALLYTLYPAVVCRAAGCGAIPRNF